MIKRKAYTAFGETGRHPLDSTTFSALLVKNPGRIKQRSAVLETAALASRQLKTGILWSWS